MINQLSWFSVLALFAAVCALEVFSVQAAGVAAGLVLPLCLLPPVLFVLPNVVLNALGVAENSLQKVLSLLMGLSLFAPALVLLAIYALPPQRGNTATVLVAVLAGVIVLEVWLSSRAKSRWHGLIMPALSLMLSLLLVLGGVGVYLHRRRGERAGWSMKRPARYSVRSGGWNKRRTGHWAIPCRSDYPVGNIPDLRAVGGRIISGGKSSGGKIAGKDEHTGSV